MSNTQELPAELVEVLKHLASKLGESELDFDQVASNINYLPKKYYNDFFGELIRARGVEDTKIFLEDPSSTISRAFQWSTSKQGLDYWVKAEADTIANYKSKHGEIPAKDKEGVVVASLTDVVKEAEDRGFANGVMTKFGLIQDRRKPGDPILEHELCDDGSFYYRNIKVRNAKGKWIKPNQPQKKSHEQAIAFSDAIHALLGKLGK